MSPLALEILLHYKSRADDYRQGDHSAPAVRDAIDAFVATGFLQVGDQTFGRCYSLAVRGEAAVEAALHAAGSA